ncbi:FAD-dependent oxidoreductase [Mesorhizobium sp. M6A.T.Ce.TU.002.03.1.1]|uniref:FAD-dependent oxidoreductase n=1 Tax=unclassified Mesorhizobium TaxID=325217 RepID=UPI000FCA1161|nr:FAD-dependent oxidoreductase [Mesorhizobium sp. M6A.T.Ce.TU.002.03.1.1]RWN24537.1 MAG: FAD-dependent oxidoreductase [Mesorhizobium sp.]
MTKLIHPVAGTIALLTILTFWFSTVLAELFASDGTIIAVKTAIPWGFLLLVPAIAAAGGSGLALSGGRRAGVVGAKLRRMPVIAANGILVLIPSALFLAAKAHAAEFDTMFYAVQTLEMIAGATNIALLSLNMRDGLKLSGRLNRQSVTHEVQLVGRDMVADGTMAFRFAKPAGFRHLAGQSISLTLLNPSETDSKGSSRHLTLASGPEEPELMVATRLRDTAFKRSLASLPMGGAVRMTDPNGDLTLHDDPMRPAVFLAGGIGITPFLAMARYAAAARLPHRITLFYSNRRPENAAFLGELQWLQKTNPNFNVVATMTAASEVAQPWDGQTGAINAALMRRHLPDMLAPIYYLAGSPAMVGAMHEMLSGLGVNDEDVRSEELSGY